MQKTNVQFSHIIRMGKTNVKNKSFSIFTDYYERIIKELRHFLIWRFSQLYRFIKPLIFSIESENFNTYKLQLKL